MALLFILLLSFFFFVVSASFTSTNCSRGLDGCILIVLIYYAVHGSPTNEQYSLLFGLKTTTTTTTRKQKLAVASLLPPLPPLALPFYLVLFMFPFFFSDVKKKHFQCSFAVGSYKDGKKSFNMYLLWKTTTKNTHEEIE